MGGDMGMFFDIHAVIIIFGGSISATLIRFPLSSIIHGIPLGGKYAFTLRRMTQLEVIEEIAGLADIARKQGPLGLEKVEPRSPCSWRAPSHRSQAATPAERSRWRRRSRSWWARCCSPRACCAPASWSTSCPSRCSPAT
jgi:flagellar motor component MotA